MRQAGRGPACGWGHQCRVGRDVPGGDLGRRQSPQTRQQQRHVVRRAARRQHTVQHPVARLVQRTRRTGQRLTQQRLALAGVPPPRRDQPVGVEGQHAVVGQLELRRLERQPAQPQRRPRRQFEVLRRTARRDHHGRRMSRPGQRAAPGHRVVHRVQTGRADLPGPGVPARLLRQVQHQVVEVGEQLVGREVDVGEGAHGRAQLYPSSPTPGSRAPRRPRRPWRPASRTAGSHRTSRRPPRSARPADSGWRPPGRPCAAGSGAADCAGG